MGVTDLRAPAGSISLRRPRRPRTQVTTGEHCHVACVVVRVFRRVVGGLVRRAFRRVVGRTFGHVFRRVFGRADSPGRMLSAVTKCAPLMLPRTRRQPPASRTRRQLPASPRVSRVWG